MNVPLIDKLLKQIKEDIETFFKEVDNSVYDMSTSLDSTIAVKENILEIYKRINILKQDLQNFRDGKEIMTESKFLKDIKEKFSGKNTNTFGKIFPPGFDDFGKF